MKYAVLIVATAVCLNASNAMAKGKTDANVCRYNLDHLSFEGSPVQQARCLVRPLAQGADLGPVLSQLPPALEGLVGKPVGISVQQMRAYLSRLSVSENDLGGSLEAPVSRAGSNALDKPLARYFVIHDTSTPNCTDPKAVGPSTGCTKRGEFPPAMNEETFPFNGRRLISRYEDGTPRAHVFVARTGVSKTGVDFKEPWRATLREKMDRPILRGKGLFLHIENIQPRIGDPPDAVPNAKGEYSDAVAPNPGLAAKQYERLALIYIAASLRKHEWMIPAFHAAIDQGISSGHDDPQNFDLAAWANAIHMHIQNIGH